MNLLLTQDKTMRYCSIACLVSVVGLLTIWVLPDTIALRHLFLIFGAFSSLVIIYSSGFFKRRHLFDIFPLVFIFLLFGWVFIHLFLFSLNSSLEFQEVKSLWMRVIAGAITAIGLCIALRLNQKLKPLFFCSLFIVSSINLGAYLYLSYRGGGFLLPQDFVSKFIFKKIEAGFFGIFAVSVACANLYFLLSVKFNRKNFTYISLWFFGIFIAIISSIVANTKNGVAISLALCVLLVLMLIYKEMRAGVGSIWKVLAPSMLIFLLLFGSWKVHAHFASNGWGSLLEDIYISSQIDTHNFWRVNSMHWGEIGGESFPKNSQGIPVAGNTYERVAWATEGVKLIKSYPLGYGSINRSFVGLLNYSKVDQKLESQTHSGWIDFTLAFGLPGIVLLLLALISIIFLGLKKGGQFGMMGAWLAIGILPFGLVAEICYKHNFEILIFFMAFAATSTITIRDLKAKTLGMK